MLDATHVSQTGVRPLDEATTPLKVPSYRLHRAKGLAVVTIRGHDIYLGKYGSPESHAEYLACCQ